MPSIVCKETRKPYFIVRTLTSIGRDRDNDLVIDHPDVSDSHAHIRLDGGRFLLMSQSRQTPISVNGKKGRKHILEHGDLISFGHREYSFNLWDETSLTTELQAQSTPAHEMDAYRRLADFSARLADVADLDTLFETLVDEVVALTGAGKGFLVLYENESWRIKTARNMSRESFQGTLNELSDSIINRVVETREPIIISDALNDTVFKSSVSVVQLKLCSVMCVPLKFGGELLGLLYVGNDNIVSLFEQESLDVLSIFASQAALLIAQALHRDSLATDNARLRVELEGKRYGELIGDSPSMREVFLRIEKIAATNINVLIRGETGTGKELIAREIHRRSSRSTGPFIAINCGAIPEDLMESALFGHRRGAFTGAIADKIGCFQAAEGGTLFLDEIGEMSPGLQVKLLRAVQERTITRIGDSRPRPVNIRLLTATHVDLESAVKSNQFREDLYYRINVVTIALPPLRVRGDDVVLLARYFLGRLADEYEQPKLSLHATAVDALRQHAWPGNIRELQNRLKKAVILNDGHTITAEHLDLTEEQRRPSHLPLAEAREVFTRNYIDAALERNGGNRSRTARELGVDPRTIFRHLERLRADDV